MTNAAAPRPRPAPRWAYAVTTVPARRDTYLPRTLGCLRATGFDRPRLFVDGGGDSDSWENEFGLEVTLRGGPPARAYGNWVCALWELWARNKDAERFALFQDDLLCVRNLRAYLDRFKVPDKGYWNLFTFGPPRQSPPPAPGFVGFHPSNQWGRGGLALVFGRQGVIDLLGSSYLPDRVSDPTRGHKNLDGAVLMSLGKEKGYTEYVHYPSLTQHAGEESAIGNPPHGRAVDFPGEAFDALSLLPATKGVGVSITG